MPTAPTPVPALPTPPSRTDPTNFRARADARLAAEPAHTNAMNALGTNVYGNAVEAAASATLAGQQAGASQASATLAQAQVALATTQATNAAASAASALAAPNTTATSTTAITPGTGARSFTTQAGKGYVAGQPLSIVSAADQRQWMVGTVTSYAGTALAVNVTAFGQAPTGGTSADWNISFWGAVPPAAKPGQVLRLRGATPEWGDASGEPIVIRSATNRHPQSEDVTGAGGAITIATASAIGPRGTMTASTVTKTSASTAFSYVSLAGYTVGQRVTYERSFRYVSGPSSVIQFNVYFYGDGSDSGVIVDLANGQVTSVYTNNAMQVLPAVRVWPQGNGWYRIALSFVVHVAGVINFYVTPVSSGNVYHVAEASITDSLQPSLYVPVPSTTPVAGAGARRRNLISLAAELDVNLGGWAYSTANITRTGKVASPIGDLAATAYTLSGAGSLNKSLVLEANTQYTASLWARLISGAPGSLFACYVSYDATGDGTATEAASIALNPAQNGPWRRYSVTFTNVAASPIGAAFYAPLLTTGSAVVALWGAQLEKGAVASNLIPTASTALDGQHVDLEPRRTHHVDTTHAAVIVAPPVIEPGDWFEIADVGGNAAVNNITVMRGPYSAIAGDAADFVIDVNQWSGRFVFDPEKGLVIT